jgi:nucleotide-binding universal stress UspA family protein
MFKVSKILVPVDLSSCSRRALAHALSLAEALGASLDVLHVAEVPELTREPQVASEKGATTLRDYVLDVGRAELASFLESEAPKDKLTQRIEAGRPRDVILEQAKKGGYDLIVMGTHGRTGRARSLAGSVTESVVRMAATPVLTVREPD